MPTIVTVTMNPALDMVVELPGLAPYAVNKARSGRIFCGGKGLNVALVLSLLGVESHACGFLGEDNAGAFRGFCRDHRIGFDFELLPGSTRTNVKLAVDGQPATDINLPGLPPTPAHIAALRRRLADLAGPDTIVVLSGSLPPGVPPGIYAELIDRLKAAKARVFLDASGPALDLALAAGPHLAKPNRDELREIDPAAGPGLPEVAAAAKRRIAGGVGVMALSMGAEGALLLSGRECLRIGRAEVKAINLVGAGDTFMAGLVYGELEGWEARRRLAFAAALAGHWVEKMERAVLDRSRVEELAARLSPVGFPEKPPV